MANEKRLIYAGDAKKLFDDIPSFIGMTGKCVQGMLDKAPTVDAVEVVHGRWIHRKETKWNLWDTSYYECSNCGSRNPLFNFNYCPNCGAKMDKNENT